MSWKIYNTTPSASGGGQPLTPTDSAEKRYIGVDQLGGGGWEEYNAQGLPNDVVVVNSLSDLPAPVANVITLDGGKRYWFGAFVDFGTNRLDVSAGGISFYGTGLLTPAIQYTGTGPFITGSQFAMYQLVVALSTGELFDLTGITGDFLFMRDVFLVAGGGFGELDGLSDLNINNCGSNNIDTGFRLRGTNWNTVVIDGLELDSSSATFVGLDIVGATIQDFKVSKLAQSAPSGAIGLLFDGDANIEANRLATYLDGSFRGGMTPLSGGGSVDDIRWDFELNDNLQASSVDANIRLSVPTTVAIGSPNTFVKVGTSNWVSTRSRKLQVTTTGDIINISERPIDLVVNGGITADPQGGSGTAIVRIVYNNDPSDPQSTITEVSPGSSSNISIPLNGVFELGSGEGISIWVANGVNSSNIDVADASLVASGK